MWQLMCFLIPEFLDMEWEETYAMESHLLFSYAISMDPNGTDIWLSGGIKYIPHLMFKFVPLVDFTIISHIKVIK